MLIRLKVHTFTLLPSWRVVPAPPKSTCLTLRRWLEDTLDVTGMVVHNWWIRGSFTRYFRISPRYYGCPDTVTIFKYMYVLLFQVVLNTTR